MVVLNKYKKVKQDTATVALKQRIVDFRDEFPEDLISVDVWEYAAQR